MNPRHVRGRGYGRAAITVGDAIAVFSVLFWAAMVVLILAGCGAFNGPANPPNAPWPVVCAGGGRCPVDNVCVAPDRCKPVAGPFGAGADGGAPTTPQRFDK